MCRKTGSCCDITPSDRLEVEIKTYTELSRVLSETPTEFELKTTQVQCCFTSIETIRTIRDGEPRPATSTFTQLLTSETVQFSVALCPQRP